MKAMQQRMVWQGMLAMAAVSVGFSACGGLDGRTVTRGPDEPVAVAGQAAGGQGSAPIGTNGGSDAVAGDGPSDMPSPFGGDTFVGGAPPVLDGPLEVVEVSPTDAANDADPTGNVSLLFSEALDEATVTSDNVQISEAGTALDGELSYSGVVATFAPAERLSLLGTYDVSVSENVTDTAGQGIESPFASSFTVRDGIWGSQKSLYTDPHPYDPGQDVASDAKGNTLFAWLRVDDQTNISSVYGRWYNAATGFKSEMKLEDGADNCQNLRLAVSPDGDAIVAWMTADSTYSQYTVRARRYVDGDWEATAQNVANAAANEPNILGSQPAVAIGGGQFVVAWVREQSYSSYAYYFLELSAAAVDGAWPDTPTSYDGAAYDSPNYEYLSNVAASIDNKGLALVAYTRSSNDSSATSSRGVYYTRKPAAANWQSSVKIPSSDSAYNGLVLASDGEGAMALWTTSTLDGEYALAASRYTKTKQFVAPTNINDPDLTSYLDLGQDHVLVSDGHAFLATWVQQVGTSANSYVTRFDIATGKWDELPTLVSDGVETSEGTSVVGIDAHGNAMVAFDQRSGAASQVMVARFTASDGQWTAADAMSPDTDGYGVPHLAVARNGVAGLLFGPIGRQGSVNGTGTRGQYRLFK